MAGGVEEGDLVTACHPHLISADMLGDTSRFSRHNVSRPQCIQQRRLAVIDMTHNGDHRRALLKIFFHVGCALQAYFDVRFRYAFRRVTEFGNDQFGCVGVDRLCDGRSDTVIHQSLDDIACPFGHPVGEFLHRDGFRNGDLAEDLNRFFGLRGRTLLALALAAHRGQAALALFVIECLRDS